MMELDAAGAAPIEPAAEATMPSMRMYALLARRAPADSDEIKEKEAAQWKVVRRRLHWLKAGRGISWLTSWKRI